MADFSTKTYCGVGMCCPYCKYLIRIQNDFLYCKKYSKDVHMCSASTMQFCGNFKPKKNVRFYPIRGEVIEGDELWNN